MLKSKERVPCTFVLDHKIYMPFSCDYFTQFLFIHPLFLVIGASLSKPHIDEFAVEFVYIYYIYNYVSYVAL